MAFRFGRNYKSKARLFADLFGVNNIFNDEGTEIKAEAVVEQEANTSIKEVSNTVTTIVEQTLPTKMSVANTQALHVSVTANLNSYTANTNSRLNILETPTGAPTGTFGSGSKVPVITVGSDGRITDISNTNVAGVTAVQFTGANNNLRVSTADGGTFDTTVDVSDKATWTALLSTNTALRAYTDTEIAALANSAPVTLNTLNELAAALGDDANFATTVTTNLGQKLGGTASVTLTGAVTGSASFSSNAVSVTTDLDVNSLTACTSIAGSDLIPVYTAAGDTFKATITNAALVGPTGPTGPTGPSASSLTNASFQNVTGDYGSCEIDGGAVGGWEGYSIGGRSVFMHNNADGQGIYNDVNNQWHFYADNQSFSRMYYNGSTKVETTSGGVSVTGTVTATSDIRYKKDIQLIDNALYKVKQLNGVTFEWNNDKLKEIVDRPIDDLPSEPRNEILGRYTGVIAQNVEKVLPEAVTDDPETGYKSVAYGNMVGLLIEAIKELSEKVEDLQEQLNNKK